MTSFLGSSDQYKAMRIHKDELQERKGNYRKGMLDLSMIRLNTMKMRN